MSEKILRTTLFSAVTAAALAFGASQAFAAPGAQATMFACEPWSDAHCIEWCQARGADTGTCDPSYVGGCRCFYW
jgi:hypothetical protein